MKEHGSDYSGLVYNELITGVKDKSGRVICVICDGMKKGEILLVKSPVLGADDPQGGLKLCVDSLYGSEIELVSHNPDTGEYTLRYTHYDIFGLDSEDITKKSAFAGIDYGNLQGFQSWYILQHNKNYDSYMPFISYIIFEESYTVE